MAQLSISLMGPIRVCIDGKNAEGFNSNKVRALLVYLVTESERPHHRDKLSTLFWPDMSSREARNNLRYALSNLRGVICDRRVHPPYLLITRDTIQFNSNSDFILDLNSIFETNLSESPSNIHVIEVEGVVKLCQSDFLEGFSIDNSAEFDDWVLLKREKINRRLAELLNLLVKYYENHHQYKKAILHARHLLKLDPWSETTHRQVMRLLAVSGQQGAAVLQYENLSSILRAELNTIPGEQTRNLYEQIRQGEYEFGTPAFTAPRIRGYEVHEILGTGQVGIVYRAHQPIVGRDVAIKVINPEFSNRSGFIRRFEQEAQVVARLEHPHIVPLYDFWRDPDGAYLVMRWIRGGNLATSIKQSSWNLESTGRVLEQLATALTTSHQQGIVHRDIKPTNILLDFDGNAYLTDFGIATLIWGNLEKTKDGENGFGTSGSLEYSSPEIVLGEKPTLRTDIYSLGIVLYEMLAGEHPFPGVEKDQLIEKHLKSSIPSIHEVHPEIPSAVDEIIRKATAKDPGKRFSDALSMTKAFQEQILGENIRSHKVLPHKMLSIYRNPYKGLSPFQEIDAADFFGRNSMTEKLLSRMSSWKSHQGLQGEGSGDGDFGGKFLALIGPSGSGKSSIVKAGLLPALRRGEVADSSKWFIVEMTPGNQPLETLEICLLQIATEKNTNLGDVLRQDDKGLKTLSHVLLPSEDDQLLIVIDQFEEIFFKEINDDERNLFIQNICEAVCDRNGQVKVLITLRADYYDRPLKHPVLGAYIADNTEVLLPLSLKELTQAIKEPAKNVGVEFEEGLVSKIIEEVNQSPGTLPMLQYALTELFEHCDERVLTHQAYSDIGGVSKALARQAESVYNQLDDSGKLAISQIFLRLTNFGEGFEDNRRRVFLTELEALNSENLSSRVNKEVLDVCVQSRLLVFDNDPVTRQPTVEITHEALLREWFRLREWIENYRDEVRTQRKLSLATDEWIRADNDASFLLRGFQLEHYLDWAKITELVLTRSERDFLEACSTAKDTLLAERTRRETQEELLRKRTRQFLWTLVGILSAALIIAIGMFFFMFNQKRGTLEAYSLSLAANAKQSLNDLDSSTALALALAANNIKDPPVESQRVLLNAAFSPGPRKYIDAEIYFPGVQTPATSVAISPDGQSALAGFSDGKIVLWDLSSGEEISRLIGHTGEVNDLAFSPDGKYAISGGEDSRVIYWDINQGMAKFQLFGHSGSVRGVDISPDGLSAISGGFSGVSYENPGELILWDLQKGVENHRFDGHNSGVVEVVFAQNGKTILASSGDTELFTDFGTEKAEIGSDLFDVILWDIQTGEVLSRFENLDHDAYNISVTSDGNRALIASYYDNISSLWNLQTLEREIILEGHRDSVRAVAISKNNQQALTGSDDGSLILWDLANGDIIQHLAAHNHEVLDVEFSPDGKTAISCARDGSIIEWDLLDAMESQRFIGHGDMVWDTIFMPDGHDFLSVSGSASPSAASQDSSIRLWDLGTGKQIRSAEIDTPVIFQVAITPDGKTALLTTSAPYLIIWDISKWSETGRLEGHQGWIPGLDISPDGSKVLTCSVDGTLIYWDLESREAIYRFDGHGKGLWAVAISPDGNTALSDSGDSSMILWDLENGKELHSYIPQEGLVDIGSSGIEYMPDGKTAISGSNGGHIILWDLESGKDLYDFGQHDDLRTRIEISEDGQIALTSGMDGTLKIWDLRTRELIREFNLNHPAAIFDISISPDGTTALSGSADNTIVLWQLINPTLDELKAWISNNRYVRSLTCEERESFRIDPLCSSE